MKNIVLIGDSIRMGYEETVRKELAEVAEVWGPEQNGGTSENVLKNLDRWVIERKPDLVHLNCGLHDLKKEFDAAENQVSLGAYETNVKTILDRMKSETNATVVFCLTTPVNEERHHANKGFDRFEADVTAYNGVAGRLAEEAGVPVHDLFQVVMDAGRDEMLSKDGVHYTDDGYVVLGKAVAGFVKGKL